MTTIAVHHRIDSGPGVRRAAIPVVFSGSLGSTLSMWEPQVPDISAHYPVIRYDIRGHGRSPIFDNGCTINDLADDLGALLDTLGLDAVHLVGLSLGGMTAMQFAVRCPERVSTLSLLCTSARLGPALAWTDRAAAVRTAGTASVAGAAVRRWFSPGFLEEYPDVVAYCTDMVASTHPEAYAACCEAIGAMDLRAELPNISAPTLLIAGEQDPATPLAHLQAIATAIPDAHLLVVGPAAHLASAEQPKMINAALLQHFASRLESVT